MSATVSNSQPNRSLRSMERSGREFWTTDESKQRSLQVKDQDSNGNARVLPQNEKLCMAFNEIACHLQTGFCYYLPARECWKKSADEKLLPRSRRSGQPQMNYPTIVYQNFNWGEATQAGFLRELQRGRYLKCNALVNAPEDCSPLYAIQVIDNSRGVLYASSMPSLVIIVAPEAYYLASTTELERIFGRWSKSWKPQGPDPQARLNSVSSLWRPAVTAEDRQQIAAMASLRHDTVVSLYNGILTRCAAVIGDLSSTFQGSDLRDLIPTPPAPEIGLALGSDECGQTSKASAEPPTRRGEQRKRPLSDPALPDRSRRSNAEESNP